MKQLSLSLLLIIGVNSLVATAQQGSRWYFGEHAGLDFSSGAPTFLPDGQTGGGTVFQEGTSCLSDSSGNLLLYSDGHTVWNGQGNVIVDSLLGGISSTQSSLLVPLPGNPSVVVLCTTDDYLVTDFTGTNPAHTPLQYGFRISYIDICTQTIVSSQKNVLVLDTVAEKLCAVRHANGSDYWILVHKFFSDAFYAFHLSSQGIIESIITNIGVIHGSDTVSTTNAVRAIGQMKFSPLGNRVALVVGNQAPGVLEVFDFDTQNGVLSVARTIALPGMGAYGIEFSPDGSKLYCSSGQVGGTGAIYQFDVSLGSVSAIAASRVDVSGGLPAWGMQLGPDGVIYVVCHATSITSIQSPDLPGIACNFVEHTITLPDGVFNHYTFPSFITGYDYSNSFCGEPIGIEESTQKLALFPNPNDGTFSVMCNVIPQNYVVIDMFGNVVRDGILTNTKNTINLSLPRGIYVWKMKNFVSKISIVF